MRRRDLLTFVVGTTLAASRVARAAASRPRLAILNLFTKAAFSADDAVLRDGLRMRGYVEGQTLDIDERDADGDTSRLPGLVRELLQSIPTIIMASSPSAAIAAHDAAPSVPIVCPILTDAMIPRLIASYARPGGSVTGLAYAVEGMNGKLVELARDALPGVNRIGLLLNQTSADAAFTNQQVAAAAQTSGIALVNAEAATTDELRAAIRHLVAEKIQALIVPPNGLFISVQPLLIDLTIRSRVPLIFASRPGAEAGGLASYGVSGIENYRRAVGYIDKILKGAAPGDLPVEFATTFELVVNLKTAKALGLIIPPTLLARADEVVE